MPEKINPSTPFQGRLNPHGPMPLATSAAGGASGASDSYETIIPIDDPSRSGALFGPADRNLRLIRAAFDVKIAARDSRIHLSGAHDNVRRAARSIKRLQEIACSQPQLSEELVQEVLRRSTSGRDDAWGASIDVYASTIEIAPRTEGQAKYVEAVRNHDLTICFGPAGTGKTYLGVALAVTMLKHGLIRSIVLVRPAVEAGEKLGFLPGDMQAKVNPYLRPLFDAMHDMMPADQVKRFIESETIEIVPLAFMRGRTLNRSAIILDEAQNCTHQQMLMFLTRLGESSKMVVTGDDTQIDLQTHEKSGLVDAARRLNGVPGVAVLRLSETDIVRHPLVERIVEAYRDVHARL